MKKTAPLLTPLLLLAGCQVPLGSAGLPASSSEPPRLADVPVHAPARFRLADFENDDELIVQFKPGREPQALPGLVRDEALDRPGRYRFRSEDPEASAALLAALRNHPDVEAAEPDYRVRAMFADDTYSRYQWALPRTHVPETWPLTRGGPLVAVLDTGVDYNHPDLAGQIVRGYDFVDDDADPMDAHGHGTHVAGVIAAQTDNGEGIAGLAPQTRILAVRVLGAEGGTASMVAGGIRYAVKQGARVINMSLGMPHDSFIIRDAVKEAIAAGCVVVGAAGNDNASTEFYPAAYPGVLAVGATTAQDARASFSNHGAWISIAAPGDSILSTVPSGYAYMSGTSMAAPHVSAAAALVMGRHPAWDSTRVREALLTKGEAVTGFEAAPAVRRLDTYQAVGPADAPTPAPTATPSPSPVPSPSPKPERPKPEQAKAPAKEKAATAPGVSQAVQDARSADDGRTVGERVSEAAREAAKQPAGAAPRAERGAPEPAPKREPDTGRREADPNAGATRGKSGK